MADDRVVEILIKFGLDDKGAKDAAKALQGVRDADKKAGGQMTGMADGLKNVVSQASRLLGVGISINAIGQAVNKYVQQAGASEEVSRRWLAATQDLDNSMVRVGKVLTEIILPVYERLAKLANEITEKPLTFQSGADASANFLNSIFPQSTSPYREAGQWGADIEKGLKRTGTTTAGVPQYGLNASTPSALNGTTSGSNPLAPPKNQFFPLEQLVQMRAFTQAEQQAERTAARSRFTMQRDFEKQEEYAFRDFNKNRFRSNRDFNIQLAFSEKEFYRERAIIARDFGIQLVRNEQDFQRSRSRAKQDHEFELYQIAMSGDAMQYWLAERSFKISEDRAKEDYEINKGRSQQDLDRQMADSELSFQIQRAQAWKERQIMLSDQEEDFNIQRERAKYQYKLALTDMDWGLREQALLRRQAFMNQYTTMQTEEQAMAALRRQFTQYQYDEFVAMMEAGYAAVNLIKDYSNNPYGGYGNNDAYWNSGAPAQGGGGGSVKKFASGGYTSEGLGYLHDNEFIRGGAEQPHPTGAYQPVFRRRARRRTCVQRPTPLRHGGFGGRSTRDHPRHVRPIGQSNPVR
jgi:hypothetical protein